MRVLKRSGSYEDVSFDKVLRRIQKLSVGLSGVHPDEVAQKICGRIYDGVKTIELDELTATTCSTMSTVHPDYGVLASRIVISNIHKSTPDKFSDAVEILYNCKDVHGNSMPLVSDDLYNVVQKNKEIIDNKIDSERDYLFDFFGYKTLERSYLQKVYNKIVERPQYMWMRVCIGVHSDDLDNAFKMYDAMSTCTPTLNAVLDICLHALLLSMKSLHGLLVLGVHSDDLDNAFKMYDAMSNRLYTHATPTLFNAGTRHSQMSSCFLLEAKDDSVDGMYDSIKDCATISKYAGGLGINIHKIRSRGSIIRGTNGKSTGTTPFLRVLNQTLLHINQAGKRNGSAAVYMDPSHPDIFEFVALRRNTGSEEERCRDLFIALWIPDLFMKRVKENGNWSLFCPFDAPGLEDVYGNEYEELYEKYEKEGKARKTIKAQDLWLEILKSQIETGGPYMLYKDKCQRSNQSNLGVIKCSNLCSEILIYSSPKEYGVCNLSSMALPSFVNSDDLDNPYFDFEKFHKTVKMAVKNMDKVIDRNFYPTPETRRSNMLHRPIGIGIQGLADTYMMLKYPYDSENASKLNRDISETMYHATLESSMEIAKERENIINSGGEVSLIPEEMEMTSYRGAYSSFATSPAAKGILQFDMHGITPQKYDFDTLKEQIKKYGLRHSLLIALMPTASTSQIMGYTESFEALTSNIYQRRTLAGEFTVINKYLLKDLIRLGVWNKEMKDRIIAGDGSIQHIKEIPEDIRNLYKTVWEISQKALINQSADRTPYVCHTQSLNLYMEDATFTKLSNMHFYAWSKGLKTGLYYLRTRAKAKTMAFTLDPLLVKETQKIKDEQAEAVLACSLANPEGCLMCSA
jgi:ribonucleoside-diphosphate reductase alpha chain